MVKQVNWKAILEDILLLNMLGGGCSYTFNIPHNLHKCIYLNYLD